MKEKVSEKSIQQFMGRFGGVQGCLEQRLAQLEVRKVKKGTLLLKAGDICESGYHVISGMLRVFYLLNGKETTVRFAEAGDACVAYASYYTQKPSFKYIEVLENSVVTVVPYGELQELYEEFPELNKVMRIGMEHSHVKSEERAQIIRSLPARERYLAMKALYPRVFEVANTEHIATFLGITRETLSRIRCAEKRTDGFQTLMGALTCLQTVEWVV